MLCWTFLFKDLCSYQTVWSTHPWYALPAYPFTLVQFANNAPWYYLQRRISTEQNFTPHRLRQINAEVENWCRIPASKWQCEWGYRLTKQMMTDDWARGVVGVWSNLLKYRFRSFTHAMHGIWFPRPWDGLRLFQNPLMFLCCSWPSIFLL